MDDASIFINYSRRDASADAGRLADSLRDYFEDRYFFMDVDQLQDGDKFPPLLKQSIDQCEVFIAVIGPRWLQMIKKTEAQGELNWVKTEIAWALKKKKYILPVLVNNAIMPLANQLPDEIKELASINAAELSHTRWTHDIERIAKSIIRRNIPLKKETKRWERKSFYVSVLIVAVLLASAIFISQRWGAKNNNALSVTSAYNNQALIDGLWAPVSSNSSTVHYSIVHAANRVVVEQFNNGVRTGTGYGTWKNKQLAVSFAGRPSRTLKMNLSDDQQTLIGSEVLMQINDSMSAGLPVTWRKTASKVR